MLALAATPSLASHPAVLFMRRVAEEFLAAARSGSIGAFLAVISRHADLPGIAMYSLGSYADRLDPGERAAYFRGCALFMARYLAEQARTYHVVDGEVEEASYAEGNDIIVPSKAILANGSSYSVTWRIARRSRSYKISDVKVLGFSLTYLQRNLFTSFLAKHDGDIARLTRALSR